MPTVAPITERRHAGGYIVWETDPLINREDIVLASGAGVAGAGLVLGKVLHGAAATSAADAGNTGNGVLGAVAVGAKAKVGDYVLNVIEPASNGGAFSVTDPDGVAMKNGKIAVAYANGGLSFTLADGATDFAAGDQIVITVAATAVKYKPHDPAAVDGSEVAAAILFSEYVDATSADKHAAANVRGPMRINAAELVWGAGVTTTNQKNAALAALKALGIQAS